MYHYIEWFHIDKLILYFDQIGNYKERNCLNISIDFFQNYFSYLAPKSPILTLKSLSRNILSYKKKQIQHKQISFAHQQQQTKPLYFQYQFKITMTNAMIVKISNSINQLIYDERQFFTIFRQKMVGVVLPKQQQRCCTCNIIFLASLSLRYSLS
jgi:hypothetical protein